MKKPRSITQVVEDVENALNLHFRGRNADSVLTLGELREALRCVLRAKHAVEKDGFMTRTELCRYFNVSQTTFAKKVLNNPSVQRIDRPHTQTRYNIRQTGTALTA